LTDFALQLEITDAIDEMYNFNFHKAEVEFNWIRYNHIEHPLSYFLYGISTWWQMMPNLEKVGDLGEEFVAYMDTAIVKSENLLKVNKENVEAKFFLAGAYGFKGRFYSERKNWTKAANTGRLALKYLEKTKGYEELSPEILFGDALFNYYSVWIRENYPSLRPLLFFFAKGDKQLGIDQLEEVASNAFYTRMEAIYFLMRIKAFELNETFEALRLAKYIHEKYPQNPYFHRFYARMLYQSGQYAQAAEVSFEILQRIDQQWLGYEEISGRYASFFLASLYQSQGNDAEAERYFKRVVQFTEAIEQEESGYYLSSQLYLARVETDREQYESALERIAKIRTFTKRKQKLNKDARALRKMIKRQI
jgi:tetratricopeptide (TPR) repeat protein